MNSKFPFVSQPDAMDCGAACISMISRYYGKYRAIDTLREMCHATREGVSLLDLSNAAEQLGFRTIGVKITIGQLLQEVNYPCIVHWKQNHFIVVYKTSVKRTPDGVFHGHVHIADPAHGLTKLKVQDFLCGWISIGKGELGQGIALLLEPTPEFYSQDEDRHSRKKLTFILRYLKPYRKHVIQLFCGVLLGSILQLVFPFLTQSIVDYGIGNRNLGFVTLILIAQLVLFFSQTIVEFIQSWILLHITVRINISMISDFLIKLMKLPIRFFDTKLIGDLLQRIQDNSRIQSFLTQETLQTFFSFFTLIVFLIVLAIYNGTIFFIFLISSCLYIFWITLFLKRRRALDYKRFAQASVEQSNLYEMVTAMQEIKLQNCEKQKRWGWENIQAKLFKISVEGLSLQQYQQAGGAFINQLKNILVSFLSARAVINGEMTLGMMVAVQYIIGQLNSPISMLISFVQSAQDAKISMERLGEIQEREDEEEKNLHRTTRIPAGSQLRVEKLSFRYGGTESPEVLKDIDLNIPAGKTTAIVGMSGSGKTTLVKLLLGFYEPAHGAILVGGHNLNNVNTHVWRTKCGAVMQDGYIFSDTIANNIAVGEERIDWERLTYAVKMANIEEMIQELPLGFNTKIGQEGNGLSQGQKQRILIARTIYKNPEFIFFDEATNSLDANNERAIMKNLTEFFRGKTVVVVAHRLSTVRHADQIVVLKDGQIKELGSHEELVSLHGDYYRLVKNQLELGN
ncbi:MAG: peptidase domain-containing ABC transporter [Bacteroides sp.]|nr:peptidase domain-containing ABC transporter [Bacteroides sp.]MCM1084761.1 peptidase domain-containing ABC transporter [Bacteroides sp.]